MKERYFDDLKAGDRFKSEPLNVTFLCVDCHAIADPMVWEWQSA